MIKVIFPLKKTFSDESYICFEYPHSKIDDKITFDGLEIHPKYLYNIMGLNGVGKSTILNILSLLTGFNGNYFKDKDSIIINHTINNSNKDSIRHDHFSYIFQDPHIINMYTVKENLEIVNQKFNFSKHMSLIIDKLNSVIDKKSKKYLVKKICDLKKNENNSPYSLSGGEKQLLSFIRAMIKPSNVIFADEPWASMDQNLKEFVEQQLYLYLVKKDVFNEFRDNSPEDDNTVIIITHLHQHKDNNIFGKLDTEWSKIIPVTHYDNNDNGKLNHSELEIERYALIK
ncbi:MAG: ATP-binding cassette domain-containing protein [Candidatus Cloacimonetes bacterium]|nr:ATP-binding cassette domain-containing protein [Candidatus Cloacimonadota bacterium]